MSSSGTEFELSDGAKVKVWVLGGEDKTKPLLIALHGAPGLSSHTEPEDSFGFLASQFRVLVYDARGSGESEDKGPLTNERWILDVDELRAWAGAETFVLAGGSYGGFLALDYALAYPTRLSGLILRDTWACGIRGMLRVIAHIATSKRVNVDMDRQVRLWSGNLKDNAEFEASFTEILPIYTPPDEAPKSFEGTGGALRLHYQSQNSAFSYCVPRFDVRARLGEIKTPTLVVVGRHDVICPVEDSEELHAGIPNSELTIFEKSGHSPPSDEPEAFEERVSKFLNGLKL